MKSALITGGATGIGKECTITLSKLGYKTFLCYNTSADAAHALADLLANVTAIKADITNPHEALALISKTDGIDVLVNNAGIAQQKLFTDITNDDWNRMFDVNVKGVFNTCKAVLPYMINQKCGKIINISSMWGQVGASCEVHYSAAKAAVIGFTKALAKEVGPSGINVNCICPGIIQTAMNDHLDAATIDALREDTPLCRIGTPADVANLVAFLASDKSSFITGQILGINGGMVI